MIALAFTALCSCCEEALGVKNKVKRATTWLSILIFIQACGSTLGPWQTYLPTLQFRRLVVDLEGKCTLLMLSSWSSGMLLMKSCARIGSDAQLHLTSVEHCWTRLTFGFEPCNTGIWITLELSKTTRCWTHRRLAMCPCPSEPRALRAPDHAKKNIVFGGCQDFAEQAAYWVF